MLVPQLAVTEARSTALAAWEAEHATAQAAAAALSNYSPLMVRALFDALILLNCALCLRSDGLLLAAVRSCWDVRRSCRMCLCDAIAGCSDSAS
jgi:hypothetical protein